MSEHAQHSKHGNSFGSGCGILFLRSVDSRQHWGTQLQPSAVDTDGLSLCGSGSSFDEEESQESGTDVSVRRWAALI